MKQMKKRLDFEMPRMWRFVCKLKIDIQQRVQSNWLAEEWLIFEWRWIIIIENGMVIVGMEILIATWKGDIELFSLMPTLIIQEDECLLIWLFDPL